MSCFALLTHHFPTLLNCILERRKIQPTFCKLDHFLLGFVVAWNCCVLHPHDISIALLAFVVHIYSEPIYGTFLHFAFFAHFPRKQTTDRLKCSCRMLSRKEKKRSNYIKNLQPSQMSNTTMFLSFWCNSVVLTN